MAWSMDKEKYIKLKKQDVKDITIAEDNFISRRTLDRWKKKENIQYRVNKYDIKDKYALKESH